MHRGPWPRWTEPGRSAFSSRVPAGVAPASLLASPPDSGRGARACPEADHVPCETPPPPRPAPGDDLSRPGRRFGPGTRRRAPEPPRRWRSSECRRARDPRRRGPGGGRGGASRARGGRGARRRHGRRGRGPRARPGPDPGDRGCAGRHEGGARPSRLGAGTAPPGPGRRGPGGGRRVDRRGGDRRVRAGGDPARRRGEDRRRCRSGALRTGRCPARRARSGGAACEPAPRADDRAAVGLGGDAGGRRLHARAADAAAPHERGPSWHRQPRAGASGHAAGSRHAAPRRRQDRGGHAGDPPGDGRCLPGARAHALRGSTRSGGGTQGGGDEAHVAGGRAGRLPRRQGDQEPGRARGAHGVGAHDRPPAALRAQDHPE